MAFKISLITIVFNDVGHIERTITSVLRQKTLDVEYIIIDGGSTDGTNEVIKKYEAHIDHWTSISDKGIYDALNKGILLSTGDLIGIVHSGDWLEDDAIQSIAQCPINDQIIIGQLKYWTQDTYKVLPFKPLDHILRYSSIPHTASFVPRILYGKIGLYPVKYDLNGDYYWFLKSYLDGFRPFYLNSVLTNFKGGGISDRHIFQVFVQTYRIQLALYKPILSKVGATLYFLFRVLIVFPGMSIKKILTRRNSL